jgi:hypothetical protein
MVTVTRRHFLLSTAALSVGCVGRGTVASAPMGMNAKGRLPAVGQSWQYAKHDLITGDTLDTEIDHVSAVGRVIEIQTKSEMAQHEPRDYPSWGARWLEKYGARDRPAGPLPSEVQDPWGMILVDPRWGELQAYERPLPLWPAELRTGWSSGTLITQYQTDNEDPLTWQLTMTAQDWESITVPAGHFTALRYINLIYFLYPNVTERVAAQRKETIWFAPEIGRWVVRENSGSFREDLDTDIQESSHRWELLSWT